jgi:hypothetical protein
MPVLTDPNGWFTLHVPDGWHLATEDSVTTLRSPAGNGIVYLSGARHSRGRQASFGGADFLARFLRSLGLEVEEAAIANAVGTGCRIYSHTRSTEAADWFFWSVTDDETALLISYARPVGDDPGDVDAVGAIVRSVRLYHSAPVH